jgi:hypothetical protein
LPHPTQSSAYPTLPKSQPPSIATTLLITLFFGLFGLIPAFIHRDRARAMGRHDVAGKYFATFWTVFLIGVALVLILAAGGR